MSDDGGFKGPDSELGGAGDIAESAGGVADVVSKVASGEVVEAGLGAAGLAAGALGDDASQVSDVRSASSSLIGAGRGLGSGAPTGSSSGAAGAPGSVSDSARYIVPEREAQQVLSGVGQAGQGAAEALDRLGGAGSSGQLGLVELHLEVADATGHWGIEHVALNERMNAVPRCDITAMYAGRVEARDLLRKEVALIVELGSYRRDFKGIVWHARATSHEVEQETTVHLTVMPAMAYLGERVDSHIYQDCTVVDVIKAVYGEVLGGLTRTIDDQFLQRSYETREYIVQYQETHLAFISRLAEEEGIFWFFDHEGDREILVLADAVGGLPRARAEHGGKVAFQTGGGDAHGEEAVFAARHYETVGATDSVVSDYDWTNPSLEVKGEQKGRSDEEPTLEVLDHTDALIFHDFSSQYGGNTATIQAQLRAARLDLDRQKWELSTTVVSAQPGRTLELEGAPDDRLDQKYLIVGASSQGHATPGRTGSWGNTLDVVPASMPYRPPRSTPRPVMPGPEVATVVGPDGSEIHTDQHGRVRVHFPWDRYHDKTAEDSSCWLRVAHNWSGPGFGTFFLPRVGMEVLVSFLGGNPDRPIVTGCVYNGTNRAGVELDAKKTQTLIRTKSSPRSDGFNEIRFEDEAGNEFIFVHAEKDLNEVVENNHSTRVKNCQTNTVDVDQTETVGHDQTMTVKNDRMKTVDGNETTFIGGSEGGPGNRAETVWGDEEVVINQNRSHVIVKDETLLVQEGKRTVTVETGKDIETYKGGRETTVSQFDTLTVDGGANRTTHVTGKYSIRSDGQYKVLQNSINELTLNDSLFAAMVGRIQLKAGDGVHYDAMPDGTLKVISTTSILFECGESAVELKADGTITIKGKTVEVSGGASSVKLEGSGVTTSGPKITASAQGVHEITGLLVKIN